MRVEPPGLVRCENTPGTHRHESSRALVSRVSCDFILMILQRLGNAWRTSPTTTGSATRRTSSSGVGRRRPSRGRARPSCCTVRGGALTLGASTLGAHRPRALTTCVNPFPGLLGPRPARANRRQTAALGRPSLARPARSTAISSLARTPAAEPQSAHACAAHHWASHTCVQIAPTPRPPRMRSRAGGRAKRARSGWGRWGGPRHPARPVAWLWGGVLARRPARPQTRRGA